MPKFDYFLKPGEELPENLKGFLKDLFVEKDFEKLSKFGGRIQISLTAPFTDRKEQDSNLILDNAFIENLKSNPGESESLLKDLTKKQLTLLSKMLQFPVTQKSTTKEIKKSIVDYLNSGEKWSKISGSNNLSKQD